MQEKELILKSKQGDEAAFAILMRAHEQKIFHLCMRMIKDEELAKDLTQETFVQAYQHLSSFRMESTFYTWIYRIARNQCLNTLRKKQPIEQEFKEEILLPSTPLLAKEKEQDPRIQKALDALSQEHRLVFELFHIQRLPQKQIAAQLHVPPGTVRSRLFYARKKIRTYLEEHPL